MNEDDIYRSSTQYRLWSFSEKALAELRSSTNTLAATRVRDAIKRVRAGNGGGGGDGDDTVECLTLEEEQKLVGYYCAQAMDFSDFCGFPTTVKVSHHKHRVCLTLTKASQATAVQFLKRFYLSNSPMTYHPKQTMPSAIFLATKTENHYTPLKDFAEKLPKTTGEAIVAPEFLLTQGLRFTFDVRHPHRGLEGGTMELQVLALGEFEPPPDSTATAKQLQNQMLQLPPSSKDKPAAKTVSELQARVQRAHDKAGETLKTSALLSDAYFLYTPPQIWISALMAADEPLALFYLEAIYPGLSTSKSSSPVLDTLRACAAMLSSSASKKPDGAEMGELKRIDKKLFKCRNPEKMDLVGINKAQKRDGADEEVDEKDEKVIKKRKLEREAAGREGNDLFGPSLE